MKPEKTNHKITHNAPSPGEFLAAPENAELATETDHLRWLAFCYVADELTTSQRADFESRLSTELEAQEALASVVELGSEIYRSYDSADGPELLERAVATTSLADRSTTLPRLLLMAAAVLVMSVIGYGLVQSGDQSTAHISRQGQTSNSQLSILADDWIDNLAGSEIEIANNGDFSDLAELAEWEEADQNNQGLDSSEIDDFGLDTSLISFYSEILDSGQEDGLLNSKSLKQKTEVKL
jgi:hypothetical protein